MTLARYLAVAVVLSVSGLVFAQPPVHFDDANLKAAVEAKLGVSDPTAADMLGLTVLDGESLLITDITGLEFGANLTGLYLQHNRISDLSPLSGLTNLEDLRLYDNHITSVSALSGLTKLTRLYLGDNTINSISALSGLTNLESLHLYENQIGNISALSGMTKLETLLLYTNQITSVSALSGLTNLEELYLFGNQISSVSALSGLTKLKKLLLGHNQISNISALSGMGDLEWLYLYFNQVVDISALAGMTNLERLYLSGNPLNQAACDVYIPLIMANNPGINLTSPCPIQYSLAISSGPGGAVTSPGEGPFTYAEGTSVPVVATAGAGYHFLNWTGTAVDAGKVDDPSSSSTSLTVDGDYTLVANFAIDVVIQYTVTVNSTAGGSTDQDGIHTVNHGDTLVINPTPNTGFNFTGWTGSVSGLADPLTVTVTSNMAIIANFASGQHTVLVSSTAGGSTNQDGSHTVNHGATLTIDPTPNAGYHFTGWTGGASGSADPLTVTVTSNMAITANFAVNQYTVTVSSTAGGSTNQNGSHTVNHGATLLINPTPNATYHFTGWTGSASGSADPLALTVTSNMVITANFAINQYTVVVSSTAGGSTDKDGNNAVNHGDTLIITPSAGTHHRFTGWAGDAVGAANPLVMTVTSNLSIAASFERTVKPPVVVTYPARYVHQTSATLMGYVTNDGGETDYEYRFSWWKEGESEPGPGSDTHHSTWTAKKSLNGKSTFTCDFPEDGKPRFEPGSIYNYRAIARNSAGFDRGGVRQFTTLEPLYVDDDAPGDPGPHDMSINDPQEDGTKGHPFDSIQRAIQVARQHDTVVVSEGVYHETLNLMGKNIHLTGFDPSAPGTTTYSLAGESIELTGFGPSIPGNTPYPVIDANGMGTVVTFNHSEDATCMLSGFVLTGGYGNPAGAILCDGSSPTIRNCLIVGNRCPDPNTDEPNGAAVFCVDSDSVLENCTISGNYGGENGVGLYSVGCSMVVANSIIWGNLPGQIQVESGNDPIIVYSDIQGTWPGSANIAEDPRFVQSGYWADPIDPELWPIDPSDPKAQWINGDYRLDGSSPCINAGDANWLYMNQPYHRRGAIDMGAYGYNAP